MQTGQLRNTNRKHYAPYRAYGTTSTVAEEHFTVTPKSEAENVTQQAHVIAALQRIHMNLN